MTDLSPETVGRMEALVRKVATWTWVAHTDADKDYAEARAIVAKLPEPVDPDLVEAREIAQHGVNVGVNDFAGGHCDKSHDVQLALAAIKRGRALAAGDRS